MFLLMYRRLSVSESSSYVEPGTWNLEGEPGRPWITCDFVTLWEPDLGCYLGFLVVSKLEVSNLTARPLETECSRLLHVKAKF